MPGVGVSRPRYIREVSMKIGDIIENGTKRVIKVFQLCGSEAIQTEPVGGKVFPMNPPVEVEEEPVEEKKPVRRGRKKA
jgi:hypothetical protein